MIGAVPRDSGGEPFTESCCAAAFLLAAFGLMTIVLPFAFVQQIREKSSWAWFVLGFWLLSILVVTGSLGQVTGMTIPSRNALFAALLFSGGGFVLLSVSLTSRSASRKKVTVATIWLLTGLSISLVGSGALRMVDWLYAVGSGSEGGLLARAVVLDRWEAPSYALCGAVLCLGVAAVAARASEESVHEELPEATLTWSFNGPTPRVRKLARAVQIIFILGCASYCTAFFCDAVFKTGFCTWFSPLSAVNTVMQSVGDAWEFYAEWLGSLLMVGLVAWYVIAEQKWGCLVGIFLALTIGIVMAARANLFSDWTGPFSAAWKAVAGIVGAG
jgi:hypothetical protein